MIDLENKIITLENNQKYEVVESINHNNKLYVYLVNIDDEMDALFQEIYTTDNTIMTKDIDKDLFEKEILVKFTEKFLSENESDKDNPNSYKYYENMYKCVFEEYLLSKINLKNMKMISFLVILDLDFHL